MSRVAVSGRLLLRNYSHSLLVPDTTSGFTASNADIIPGSSSFWIAMSIKLGAPPLKATGNTYTLASLQAFTTNGFLISLFNGVLNININSAGTTCSFQVLLPSNTSKVINFVRVFLVFDPSGPNVKCYRDGALFATSPTISAWNITSTTNDLSIGNTEFFGGHTTGCPGYYNDVQYGTGSVPVLADIQADYFNGIVAPGCKHRWLCTDSSGSTVVDSVGAANGTVNGSGSFVTTPVYLAPRVTPTGRVPVSNRVHT